MSSVDCDWMITHSNGRPGGRTSRMAVLGKSHRSDDRPEGYYVDSGTYPVMPKSRELTTDEIYSVLDQITPGVHNATLAQFSHVEPGL